MRSGRLWQFLGEHLGQALQGYRLEALGEAEDGGFRIEAGRHFRDDRPIDLAGDGDDGEVGIRQAVVLERRGRERFRQVDVLQIIGITVAAIDRFDLLGPSADEFGIDAGSRQQTGERCSPAAAADD